MSDSNGQTTIELDIRNAKQTTTTKNPENNKNLRNKQLCQTLMVELPLSFPEIKYVNANYLVSAL